MDTVFLEIVNMSITASWVVVAILLVRLLLTKAPKWISCVLWSLVGLRLVLPFSFESIFSLIPSTKTIDTTVYSARPYIETGIGVIDNNINEYIGDRYFEGVTVPENTSDILLTVLGFVWIAGIALMLIYTAASFLRLKKQVSEAVPTDDIAWICDSVNTPFILGIVRPRIYLPSDMNESDREYVIAHEKAHLKRRDHLWKPIGFLILSVYWFNPLIWLAYVLLCRDIEVACDEKVIKERGLDIKKPYSEALINCSVPRRSIAACPIAFGEVGVKERVKNVLNYKTPAFWIIIVALIACLATAVCFLTNPRSENPAEKDFGNIKVLDVGSDREDVSIEVVSFKADNKTLKLTVRWSNDSTDTLDFGEPFTIFQKQGSNWDRVETNVVWTMPAYPVLPNQKREKEYTLTGYSDFTEKGTYRFCTEYNFEKIKGKKYSVWVDFELKEPVMSYEDAAEKVVAMIENGLSTIGAEFNPAIDTSNRILSGASKNIELSGGKEVITVYQYDNAVSARKEAGYVSPDGYSISRPNGNETAVSQIDFMSEPHWYLYGNVIVCYDGRSNETGSVISAVCGTQFAGVPIADPITAIRSLREKYPEFFDLDDSEGLIVYIWQMAENHYSCALESAKYDEFTDKSLIVTATRGASIAEMKTILAAYDTDKVEIRPACNPISSYYYEINDEYIAKVKRLFGRTAVSYAGAPQLSDYASFVSSSIMTQLRSTELPTGLYSVESHITLDTVSSALPAGEDGERFTEYMIVCYEEYSPLDHVPPCCVVSPVVLTYDVRRDGTYYAFADFWMPEEGSGFERSIRDKFPVDLADMAINCTDYEDRLREANLKKVNAWMNAEWIEN